MSFVVKFCIFLIVTQSACGCPNKKTGLTETVPNPKQVKVVLTIAHLDHDETNWDVKDERLKASCQICHLRYDAKEKYRRQKANCI